MTLTAAVAFTVTVRCAACGDTIPCGTIADAVRRQDRHTGITGHATVVEVTVTA